MNAEEHEDDLRSSLADLSELSMANLSLSDTSLTWRNSRCGPFPARTVPD